MKRILPILFVVLFASCAGKKAVTEQTVTPTTQTTKPSTKPTKHVDKEQTEMLRRIANQALTTKNIVASADFRLVGGGKNLSCDGKISMRRDEVIRLQLLLPIIRTEIARIDFTPEYVLLVDRYHKEYIKASYKEVSFLADNGISFYSLQSLFWNELFLPGENHITERLLDRLTCELAQISTDVPVTYKKGNISYLWTASKATANIKAVDVKYSSQQYGTFSLHWTYDNFRTVGGKAFPLTQQFNVTMGSGAKKKSAQLTVKMSSPKTSSDWDAKTEVSAKYKKIEAKDILGKLLSIQ